MISPQTLLKYPIFGGMAEEQIEKIIPLLKKENFGPDEFIITEGKPNDRIYFLIKGQVSVARKDMILTKFGEGEAFGEMEVLDVMPAVASIKSVTEVNLMSISNRTLREIYKIDVKIFSLLIMNLARDLSRRLRKTDERLADTPILI